MTRGVAGRPLPHTPSLLIAYTGASSGDWGWVGIEIRRDMRALIVCEDGFSARNVLAASRSLGRAGWTVGIGSPRRGLAASSRYVSYWHPVPEPSRAVDPFVEAINSAIAKVGYEVIFPGGDAEVLGLTIVRDRLQAHVPYPGFKVAVRSMDKLELMAPAARAGLRPPRTVTATEAALEAATLPIVVKASLHWTPGTVGAPMRLNAMTANTRVEARRRAAEIESAGGHPLFQEYIRGAHYAHVALIGPDGGVVAHLQQRGLGTWPRDVGVWTRAETVPLDAELAERSTDFLREVGWRGLVQLQFLVPDGERPRLIDFNGRFYASLSLAIAAGVDLPVMWASLATDRTLQAEASTLSGVRYQWLEGDLRRALAAPRAERLGELMSTLRYRRGAIDSLWSRDDPAPGLRWLAMGVRHAVQNRSRTWVRIPDK